MGIYIYKENCDFHRCLSKWILETWGSGYKKDVSHVHEHIKQIASWKDVWYILNFFKIKLFSFNLLLNEGFFLTVFSVGGSRVWVGEGGAGSVLPPWNKEWQSNNLKYVGENR